MLAAVFATAGGAKLADLDGSRRAMAGFGVPSRFAGRLGRLVPALELLAAALLACGPIATGLMRAGALTGLVLIAVFSGAILLSLARGRAPDCHCFGQLHSTPAGPRTLARNGVLLILAAFLAGGGDPAWAAAAAVFAVAVLAVAIPLRGDSGSEGSREIVREGLPVGTRAPDFELAALQGPPLSLDALLGRGQAVLLVFTDPHCGPCLALAPEIAGWQRAHASELTIAVIENRGGGDPPASDAHGRRNVLLQGDHEVADAYRAHGTPSAVLVGTDGEIASPVAPGAPAIKGLLARTVPGTGLPAAPEPGAATVITLDRRDLVGRAATGWAAAMALLTPSALGASLSGKRRCRHEQCGGRCCPKKAKCRRRGGRRVCVCPDGRRACRRRCCPEKAKCRKRGKRRVCVCPGGRTACGKRCCPDTFVCRRRGRRRRCVCPEGFTECGRRCVRIRTDPRNCGRCGRVCPTGTSCVDGDCQAGDGSGTGPGGSGACDCPPGKACCDGACTDLNESEEHCGDCGKTCPGGKTCCDGHCLDLQSDPRNCGRCGRRCPDNEVCSEGECRRRCARGLKNCRGSCVDTRSNSSNCGRCGISCTGPFDTGECCNGKCCDINGSTCCPGGCKNLSLDDDNCGACGKACGPGSFCRFGVCTKPV